MRGSLGPSRRQRYGLKRNEDLFDPAINVRAAWDIYLSAGRSFRPWGAFTSGGYKRYGRYEKAQRAYEVWKQNGMSWRVAPCIKAMIAEANRIAPNRSKASDGTIGDAAHAGTKSEHNPDSRGIVHAVDLTHDPRDGWDCHKAVGQIVSRRDPRVLYIIWNGKMWRNYDRPGIPAWSVDASRDRGHHQHMHVSVKSGERYENDVSGWFEEDELTPEDKEWIEERIKFYALRAAAVVALGQSNGAYKVPDDYKSKSIRELIEESHAGP